METLYNRIKRIKKAILLRPLNKISYWLIWLQLGLVFFILPSCFDSDDIGGNYYTFTGEMMGEYLKLRPELYSEFYRALDTTGVINLLNAYGEYTCFAPNNKALKNFYQKHGRNSLSQFPLDSIEKMIYDHLIQGIIISSTEFTEGRISIPSMSDRYIDTKFGVSNTGLPVIYVNGTSPITVPDYEVHNGIVHTIGQVLEPTELKLKEALERDSSFSLFYRALMATELYKELELVEDKDFVPMNYVDFEMLGDWVPSWSKTPRKKLYGYTALVESDSTYEHVYGIKDLDGLKQLAKQIYDEVYPQDANITDVTDRKNSLNRFVAYHLLDRQVNREKFMRRLVLEGVILTAGSHHIAQVDMFDYIETMCPNTLLEVRTLNSKSEPFGVFNMVDQEGIQAVRIKENNFDIGARNGVYHEIDRVLAYSKDFVSMITSKRIRLDAATFFSELTNNNMRCSGLPYSAHWILPSNYLKNMKVTEGTQVNYLAPFDRYCNFQGDEIFSSVTGGIFDVTITLPPIPAGTYEVRFGYLTNGKRGVSQLYFDDIPCGIPVNFNITGTSDPLYIIGWQRPGSDPLDPQGSDNDKAMRNRGYMKGPASIQPIVSGWQPAGPGRSNPNCLRKILGVYTFTEDGKHTLRCKAAESDGEFMLDYIEFVPSEAIEKEDVY